MALFGAPVAHEDDAERAILAALRMHGALEGAPRLELRMSYPYGQAMFLRMYGLLQQERGERSQGRQRLEEALAIFRRLGAKKEVEWTEQVLTNG